MTTLRGAKQRHNLIPLLLFCSLFIPLSVHALSTSTSGATTVTGSYAEPASGGGGGGYTPPSTPATPTTPETAPPAETPEAPVSEPLPDLTPPVISDIAIEPHISFAVISWKTSEDADSQIAYGRTKNLGELTADVNLTQNHSLTIANLRPNSKYYFVLRSTDAGGNQGASDLSDFITLKDANPPANVGGFQIESGDNFLSINWNNPIDIDFAGVLIRRDTVDYPKNINEGIKAYQGVGEKFKDTDVANGVLYYYAAFAYDSSGNYASGALALGAPLAVATKKQCEDGLDNDGDGLIDFPADPGCGEAGDNGEAEVLSPPVSEEILPMPAAESIITETPSGLRLEDARFYTARRALPIKPDANGVLQLLAGQILGISIDSKLFSKAVENITLQIASSAYLLGLDQNNFYSTDIMMPSVQARYAATVNVVYQDGITEKLSFFIETAPFGLVYETTLAGRAPAAEARAELFFLNAAGNWELWNASGYHQINPQITGENGAYGWAAPADGVFFLEIKKDGYWPISTNRFTNQNTVNQNIELTAFPPSLKEAIDPNASLTENINQVAQNLGQKTVFAGKIIKKEAIKFITNPVVKQGTKTVAAPAVTGAAAVTATSAVGFSNLLNYLRFLFTQPILILFRRKRKGWGIVYNSLTKLPVELVTVRLVEAASGRVIQSRVTDKEGRYAFFPSPGNYRMEIQRGNFHFPTEYLKDVKEDGHFLDIYHGEVLNVTEKGAVVTANIPLDPETGEKPVGKLIRDLVLRRLQRAASLTSLILMIIFFAIAPGATTAILLGCQILFFLLLYRFVYHRKPKNWGIVYDASNRAPIFQSVARIFDRQYNKLLETQLTDKRGRYAFLVGRNEYFITYEKDGYQKKQSDYINLKESPETAALAAVDAGLEPEQRL